MGPGGEEQEAKEPRVARAAAESVVVEEAIALVKKYGVEPETFLERWGPNFHAVATPSTLLCFIVGASLLAKSKRQRTQ